MFGLSVVFFLTYPLSTPFFPLDTLCMICISLVFISSGLWQMLLAEVVYCPQSADIVEELVVFPMTKDKYVLLLQQEDKLAVKDHVLMIICEWEVGELQFIP